MSARAPAGFIWLTVRKPVTGLDCVKEIMRSSRIRLHKTGAHYFRLADDCPTNLFDPLRSSLNNYTCTLLLTNSYFPPAAAHVREVIWTELQEVVHAVLRESVSDDDNTKRLDVRVRMFLLFVMVCCLLYFLPCWCHSDLLVCSQHVFALLRDTACCFLRLVGAVLTCWCVLSMFLLC